MEDSPEQRLSTAQRTTRAAGGPMRPRRRDPHHVARRSEVKRQRVILPGEDSAGRRLATAAPFHLEATVRVLQRRPVNRVEVWEDGRYLRVLTTADGLVLIDVENHGTVD